MSETADRTVTDATGRILLVREMDVLEEIDLFEVAGPVNSVNPAWLGTAMTVCSVRAINGKPRPFPRTMDQYRAAVTAIGKEGRDAVRRDRYERQDAEEAAAAAKLAEQGEPVAKEDPAKN